MRPGLIVLKLAHPTRRKLDDDIKTREIQNVRKFSPPPPPPLAGGKGRVPKMAQVPEGGNFAILSPKLIVNKTAELFH